MSRELLPALTGLNYPAGNKLLPMFNPDRKSGKAQILR